MLNPELIVSTFTTALSTISLLTEALGPDPPSPARPRLSGFWFEQGLDVTLAKAIVETPEPGILVTWTGFIGGNFDGTTIWKHKLDVYIKPGNAADPSNPAGQTGPAYLAWLIVNQPVNIPGYSTTLNIRNTQILPGLLLCDTPSTTHHQDQDELDFFCMHFTLPEIGDN